LVRERFNQLPFERAMERCPDKEGLHTFLKVLFNVRTANAIHRGIAQALIAKRIQSIVTTNYDCCLDDELSRSPGIAQNDDVFSNPSQAYWKIHGSADDETGERPMIFTLRQESSLDERSRHLLKTLWCDRVVLIVGYSGTDFEICPEIPALRPKRIIWNFLSRDDITTTACEVMRRVPGVIVIGDMLTLFELPDSPVHLDTKPSRGKSKNVAFEIGNRFSPITKLLWRLQILTTMTCAGPALRVADRLIQDERMSASERYCVLKERARALYYGGFHKRAALGFESVATMPEAMRESTADMLDLQLAACDSWRSYGDFVRARKSLATARRIAASANDVELTARVQMKRLALLRQLYKFTKALRLIPMAILIRRRASHIIKPLIEPLVTRGLWTAYYELRTWGDRFDIPAEITSVADRYHAPPPRQGYWKLGDVMGQMITLRDDIRRTKHLSEERINEIENLAQQAEDLGILAEAWKLHFCAWRKYRRVSRGKNSTRATYAYGKFKENFGKCEYHGFRRIIVLLLNL